MVGLFSVFYAFFMLSQLYFIKHTGRYTASLHCFLVVAIAMMVVQIFWQERPFDDVLYVWFATIPLSVALVGNFSATIIWTSVPILVSIGIFLYTRFAGAEAQLEVLIQRCFSIFFTGGLSAIYRKNQELLTKTVEDHRDSVRMLLRLVCHDMANSITMASGRVFLLKDAVSNHFSERQKKDFARLGTSLLEMESLLAKVRSMEAASGGKMNLKLSALLLTSALEEVCEILAPKLQEKEITLEIHYPSMEGVVIMADSVTLQHQVLVNILTNAIKFSRPKGVIRMEAQVSSSKVHLSIIDAGIGMPPQILKKIFDPVSDTSRRGTSGEKGTGFGMPICKVFMEKYDGLIGIESTEGKGTTVTLTFARALKEDEVKTSA